MSKVCADCFVSKRLDTCYYKAGAYWQKRCKLCHNKLRTKYRKGQVPKPKYGWNKLTPEIQKSIRTDIRSGHKKKDVASRYSIKYGAIAKYVRDGLI